MAGAQLDPALPQQQSRPLGTPYDDNRVTPESQGANIGGALQQMAGVAADVAQQARHAADASAVLGAMGQAQKAVNDIILDPEQGYRALKGDAAIEQRGAYLEKFNAALDAANNSLSNGEQRRAFGHALLARREEGLRHVYTWENHQIEQVSQAKYDGAQIETLKTLQSVVGNPLEADTQLARFRQQATVEAMRRMGPTATPQMVSSFVAPEMERAAVTMMEGAFNTGDVAGTRAAMLRVGDLLPPAKRNYYSQSVDKMEADQKVQAAVSGILSKATDPISGKVDPDAVVQAAATLPEDANKGSILKELHQRQTLADSIWKERVGAVAQRAMSKSLDPVTGMISLERADPRDVTFLRTRAPEQFDALKRKELRDANSETPMEREAYAKFLLDFGNNPKRYAGLSDNQIVEQFFPSLSTSGFEKAASQIKVERMREQNTLKGNASFLGAPLKLMVHESGMMLMGHAKSVTKEQNIRESFIRDAVAQQIGTVGDAKTLDVDAVRKMIEDAYSKGKVLDTGTLWDDTATRGEFLRSPKYGGKTFIPAGGGAPELRPNVAPVGEGTTSAPAGYQRITTPKGAIKLVPQNQLDAALKAGAKLAR